MGSPKCEDQESKAARDLILQAASSRITKDGLVVPFAAASAASPARNFMIPRPEPGQRPETWW